MILSLGVVLCALVAVLVVPRIVRWRRAQLLAYENGRDKFYSLAHEVLQEPDVPDLVLSMLEIMTSLISDASHPRRVLLGALRGKLRGQNKFASDEVRATSSEDIPEPIREKFLTSMIIAVVSNTYLAPLSGPLLRRLTFYALSPKNPAPVETIVSNYRGWRGPHDPPGVPA